MQVSSNLPISFILVIAHRHSLVSVPSVSSGISSFQSEEGAESALLFHSLLLVGYALLLWVVVHLFVVFFEELTLRRQFGESYKAYLRTVPRWLPRFSPQRVPDR